MNVPFRPDSVDPLIHERARLSIMAALAATAELSFGELKETLGMSDGNLSTHAQKLEKAGLLTLEKTRAGRRRRTTLRITDSGREALEHYLETLRALLLP